jgi:hypothetical protein
MARQYIEIEEYDWWEIIIGIFIIFCSIGIGFVINILQPCVVPILISMVVGAMCFIVLICGCMFIYESKKTIKKYVKTEGR